MGFFPGLAPPEEFASHCKILAAMTIMRSQIVRARIEEPNSQRLQYLCAEFLSVFNGDLRVGHVQHFCVGACCSFQTLTVTIQRATALMMDVVFSHLGATDSTADSFKSTCSSVSVFKNVVRSVTFGSPSCLLFLFFVYFPN